MSSIHKFTHACHCIPGQHEASSLHILGYPFLALYIYPRFSGNHGGVLPQPAHSMAPILNL